MPKTYKNHRNNFANFQEFKEVAIKTINEQFGRVTPLDVFDFAEEGDQFKCVAYWDHENIPAEQQVGDVLSEDTQEQERIALENAAADLERATTEANENAQRIRDAVALGLAVSPEDEVLAAQLGIAQELQQQTQDRINALQVFFESDGIEADAATIGQPVNFRLLRGDAIVAEGSLLELEQQVVDSELVEDDTDDTDGEPTNPVVDEIQANGASNAAIALAAENNVDLNLIEGTGSNGVITVADVQDYIANNAPVTENADDGNEQPNA